MKNGTNNKKDKYLFCDESGNIDLSWRKAAKVLVRQSIFGGMNVKKNYRDKTSSFKWMLYV